MEKEAKRRRPVVRAAAVAVAVAAAGGGVWASGAFGSSCDGSPVEIRIAAQPGLAPALNEIASRFNAEGRRVGEDRCARAVVEPVEPAEYVRAPTGADVWIPESGLWLGAARRKGQRNVPPFGRSIATTPVVLAAPRPVAAELRDADVTASWRLLLRDRAGGLELVRRAVDPARGMAGAVTALGLARATGGQAPPREVTRALLRATPKAGPFDGITAAERFDRHLVAAGEQAVVAYNQAHRPNPLAALAPREGTLLLDHPYTVLTKDWARADAAEAFRSTLGARAALDVLHRGGFRTPEGTFPAAHAQRLGLPAEMPRILRLPTPKEIERAMAPWR
ncbi:substrate-binding domain-containing protein [Actinomadura kijaniata]|uniref:substrate-binding domain-containing protein n=1 Tax=Actinomadura kijaniata TaxID=46161 RepID=UPI00082D20BC|nr:substrate-binding domain-containing protein [Actinomadura kijaniata]